MSTYDNVFVTLSDFILSFDSKITVRSDTAGILQHVTCKKLFKNLNLEKHSSFCNFFELMLHLEIIYNLYILLVP